MSKRLFRQPFEDASTASVDLSSRVDAGGYRSGDRGGLIRIGRDVEQYDAGVVSVRIDCDRNVIRQARNLEEHRGLLTHTER